MGSYAAVAAEEGDAVWGPESDSAAVGGADMVAVARSSFLSAWGWRLCGRRALDGRACARLRGFARRPPSDRLLFEGRASFRMGGVKN